MTTTQELNSNIIDNQTLITLFKHIFNNYCNIPELLVKYLISVNKLPEEYTQDQLFDSVIDFYINALFNYANYVIYFNDNCYKVKLFPGHFWTIRDTKKLGPFKQAKIVVCGKHPGPEELQKGFLFCGPSGHYLASCWIKAGLPKDLAKDVYLTNVMKHIPVTDDSSPMKKPFVEVCLPLLYAEFLLLKPKKIICAGAEATKFILGVNTPLKELLGCIIPVTYYLPDNTSFTSDIIPVLHPAFIAKEPSQEHILVSGLSLISDKHRSSIDTNINYKVCTSFDDIKEVLNRWKLSYEEKLNTVYNFIQDLITYVLPKEYSAFYLHLFPFVFPLSARILKNFIKSSVSYDELQTITDKSSAISALKPKINSDLPIYTLESNLLITSALGFSADTTHVITRESFERLTGSKFKNYCLEDNKIVIQSDYKFDPYKIYINGQRNCSSAFGNNYIKYFDNDDKSKVVCTDIKDMFSWMLSEFIVKARNNFGIPEPPFHRTHILQNPILFAWDCEWHGSGPTYPNSWLRTIQIAAHYSLYDNSTPAKSISDILLNNVEYQKWPVLIIKLRNDKGEYVFKEPEETFYKEFPNLWLSFVKELEEITINLFQKSLDYIIDNNLISENNVINLFREILSFVKRNFSLPIVNVGHNIKADLVWLLYFMPRLGHYFMKHVYEEAKILHIKPGVDYQDLFDWMHWRIPIPMNVILATSQGLLLQPYRYYIQHFFHNEEAKNNYIQEFLDKKTGKVLKLSIIPTILHQETYKYFYMCSNINNVGIYSIIEPALIGHVDHIICTNYESTPFIAAFLPYLGCRNLHDTMLAAHAVWETGKDFGYGLESLAQRLCGIPRYDKHLAEWVKNNPKLVQNGYGFVPDEIILGSPEYPSYASWDVLSTLALWYQFSCDYLNTNHLLFSVPFNEIMKHDEICCSYNSTQSVFGRRYLGKSNELQDRVITNYTSENSCWGYLTSLEALPVVVEMELVGMKIDRQRLEALGLLFSQKKQKLIEKMRSLLAWPDFNPNSVPQCQYALYKIGKNKELWEDAGYKSCEFNVFKDLDDFEIDNTMDGDSSTNRSSLIYLLRYVSPGIEPWKIEFLQALIDYRTVTQMLRLVLPEYVFDNSTSNITKISEGYLKFCDNSDKVHTTFWQTKETGRFSTSNPPLQNISKKQEVEYKRIFGSNYLFPIRSIFKASEGKIIEVDYSAAEAAMMGIQSKCSQMIHDCVELAKLPQDHPDKADIHSIIAVKTFNLCVPQDPKKYSEYVNKCLQYNIKPLQPGQRLQPTKEHISAAGYDYYRYIAKTIIFGLPYGRGNHSILKTLKLEGLNVDMNDIIKLRKFIAERYSQLESWLLSIHKAFNGVSYDNVNINSWCFRLRRFSNLNKVTNNIRSMMEREARNAPIQGGVADLVSKALFCLYVARMAWCLDLNIDPFDLEKLPFRFILQLHDAIFVEAKDEYLNETIDLIKTITTNIPIYSVPSFFEDYKRFYARVLIPEIDLTPYYPNDFLEKYGTKLKKFPGSNFIFERRLSDSLEPHYLTVDIKVHTYWDD